MSDFEGLHRWLFLSQDGLDVADQYTSTVMSVFEIVKVPVESINRLLRALGLSAQKTADVGQTHVDAPKQTNQPRFADLIERVAAIPGRSVDHYRPQDALLFETRKAFEVNRADRANSPIVTNRLLSISSTPTIIGPTPRVESSATRRKAAVSVSRQCRRPQ